MKNKMGVLQLTTITMVNMLGSGIVILPANLAQVGTMSILSWLITASGATCLAYCFAKAGIYTKNDGGMGGYAKYAYGTSGAFLANFTYAISLIIANVAVAISAVGYFEQLFHFHFHPIVTALATILTLWLASIMNFGGAELTGRISTCTVWGVILPIVFISIFGWLWFNSQMFIEAWNPHHLDMYKGVSSSIAITLWAFLGLESASANMDAVENPRKNVPIAILGGTLGAALMYIISTNVIQGIVKNTSLSSSTAPFGLAFSQMFNPVVGDIVMGLMIIACFGSLLDWQFTIAEVFRSSAQEGYFPKIFKQVISNGTPKYGIIVITFIQSVLALMTISPSLSKQFTILVDLAVVTNVVPYLLSLGALKTMQIDAMGKLKNKKVVIMALIGSIYSLYAIFSAGNDALAYGALVTFAGCTLYGLIANEFNKSKEN